MKKAQMQGGETIAVMIIIVVLIIIGLVFGLGRTTEKIEKDANQIDFLNSIRIAIKVTNLQEIKCSRANSGGNTCIDKYKVLSLSELIKENNEAYVIYQGIFENTQIKINEIYPGTETYTIYDYNDSINKSRTATYVPILLWDPIKDTKQFGIMEVATYN
ncbi:hypothetical protein K9L67_03645 [Candidatus Woesearchaeota archaeon]|nr:hypothetical protein [Candidatus Woesearchaeota archaeon]MCF7901295.1 hypothetical protein [Candidatus Woesearchaeota archaeon]MCF8013799.1 hypothetical protein [Candidatus Woesearchaeota archaeon]